MSGRSVAGSNRSTPRTCRSFERRLRSGWRGFQAHGCPCRNPVILVCLREGPHFVVSRQIRAHRGSCAHGCDRAGETLIEPGEGRVPWRACEGRWWEAGVAANDCRAGFYAAGGDFVDFRDSSAEQSCQRTKRLDPQRYDADDGGQRYRQECPDHAPDQAPEPDCQQDDDGVKVQTAAEHFGFEQIALDDLNDRQDHQDQSRRARSNRGTGRWQPVSAEAWRQRSRSRE